MSSSRRRFPVRLPVVVDIGCGCRRPKLSSLFSFAFSKPRNPKAREPLYPSSYSTTTTTSPWETTATTTTTTTTTTSATSPYERTPSPPAPVRLTAAAAEGRRRGGRKKKKGGGRRAAGESVAVVKESSAPYLDFKESMLQMIVENEMYGWDDLNALLHRLLSLNSPDNHPLIICAFADIWNGVLSLPDE